METKVRILNIEKLIAQLNAFEKKLIELKAENITWFKSNQEMSDYIDEKIVQPIEREFFDMYDLEDADLWDTALNIEQFRDYINDFQDRLKEQKD
jgi:hypothetical protein